MVSLHFFIPIWSMFDIYSMAEFGGTKFKILCGYMFLLLPFWKAKLHVFKEMKLKKVKYEKGNLGIKYISQLSPLIAMGHLYIY